MAEPETTPESPFGDPPATATRAEILARIKNPERIVDVPGVGRVRIQKPTMEQTRQIIAEYTREDGTVDHDAANAATLLAHLPDLDPADIEAFRAAPADVFAELTIAIYPEAADEAAAEAAARSAGPLRAVDFRGEPGHGAAPDSGGAVAPVAE